MSSTAGYHRVNAQTLRHQSGVRVGHVSTTTGNKREIEDVPQGVSDAYVQLATPGCDYMSRTTGVCR